MYKLAMKQGLRSVGESINFPLQQSTLNNLKTYICPCTVRGCMFIPICTSVHLHGGARQTEWSSPELEPLSNQLIERK